MNMWIFLGVFVLYLVILRWVIGAARKTALKEGFQNGYQEGFTDAEKYLESEEQSTTGWREHWWEMADAQVEQMRAEIRNEERWPIGEHLEQIAAMFKQRPKITIVIRTPWLEAEGKDGGVVLTDDDFDAAIAEINRLRAKPLVEEPSADGKL